MTATSLDFRDFVRAADDRSYVASATVETPRSRVVDLYGPLAQAREQAHVHLTTQSALLGLEDYRKQAAFNEVQFACVLSYAECAEALGNPAMSSRFWNDTIGHVWGMTIIGMDGADHRRHRALVTQAFTRKSLARWEDELVAPAVHGLIDRFAERGQADLYREFTLLFPVYVITELLGLPRDDIEKFTTWAGETLAVFYDQDRALLASRNLEEYLTPLIEDRRGSTGEDLISLLANAELDGERLDTIEIVSFLRLLLPAGGETTARSTASMLLALLNTPDQLAAVIHDRELVPNAIEEGLRFEPPLSSINRIAVEDVAIGGVDIPSGTVVEMALGAANRDGSRWKNPDTFDIYRDRKPHLAFAWGQHACIGAHLARLEMGVALNALFDRLPGLRIDPEAGLRAEVRGIGLRSPNMVPVLFG